VAESVGRESGREREREKRIEGSGTIIERENESEKW
jgi:hypothetical protein